MRIRLLPLFTILVTLALASCVPGRKLYRLEIKQGRTVQYQGYYDTADSFPTERLWERLGAMRFYAGDDPKAIQPQVGTKNVTLRAATIDARHGETIARSTTFETITLSRDEATGLWRISNNPRESP